MPWPLLHLYKSKQLPSVVFGHLHYSKVYQVILNNKYFENILYVLKYFHLGTDWLKLYKFNPNHEIEM